MNFQTLIFSRAHRILRPMERFSPFNDVDSGAWLETAKFYLRDGEKLVGIYRNDLQDAKQSVIVTTHGIAVQQDEWRRIAYDEIRSASIWLKNPPEKSSANGIILLLRTGEQVGVTISGGDRKFRDAYEVLRFIGRAVEDKRKRTGVSG